MPTDPPLSDTWVVPRWLLIGTSVGWGEAPASPSPFVVMSMTVFSRDRDMPVFSSFGSSWGGGAGPKRGNNCPEVGSDFGSSWDGDAVLNSGNVCPVGVLAGSGSSWGGGKV